MDFIKHIKDSFANVEFVDSNVLSESVIEDHISALQKNLVDTIQNYASFPIIIARTEAGLKELEETDTTDLSEDEQAQIKGGINQHKLQLATNKGQMERAQEDIAYFQVLITNWQSILAKFTK